MLTDDEIKKCLMWICRNSIYGKFGQQQQKGNTMFFGGSENPSVINTVSYSLSEGAHNDYLHMFATRKRLDELQLMGTLEFECTKPFTWRAVLKTQKRSYQAFGPDFCAVISELLSIVNRTCDSCGRSS